MLSPNLTDSNKKLDEQIKKLRECKAEMIQMFHDMDNLIDSKSQSSFYCDSHSSLSKSNSKLYDISSSESDYLNSDSEYDSDFYEPSVNRHFDRRPSLSFSFKFPIETDYNNILTYSSYAPNHGQKHNYDQYARSNSFRSPKKQKKRSLSSFNHTRSQTNMRQTFWKPVGRAMSKSAVFSSSQDLNKTRKKIPKDLRDIGKGWKPTLGKSKEDLRIYSSSSYEKDPFRNVTVKKKNFSDPKDVGQGWKNILSKPKDNFNVYARPVPEKEPFKTVVVRQKIPIDPRDIRRNEVSRKKTPKPSSNSDFAKEPFKSVTVKRKIFKDERDVGDGWKPVCVKSRDDLKMLYEKPPVVDKKISVKKNADVGKEWRPNGKVKPDNPYKSDFVLSDEKNLCEKKNLKEDKNGGKGWKPNGKVKPDNPYKSTEIGAPVISKIRAKSKVDSKPPKANKLEIKPKLDLDIENVNEAKNDEDIYKTSTPNISKKLEDDDLQESVILNEHGDNDLAENKLVDEPNLEMENFKSDETLKSIEIKNNEEEVPNESVKNTSKKSNLDYSIIEENQSKKSRENELNLEQKENSVASKNSNVQVDENNELEQSKKSITKVSDNGEEPNDFENRSEINLGDEVKSDKLIENQDEIEEKNDTIKKSEIVEKANEIENKSEIKEESLKKDETEPGENSKIIENNDEKKSDVDNKNELNEQNDDEKENQLWKFQESDEE